jgi:RNA polymerase sigma-70 factor (ECF subfamily)
MLNAFARFLPAVSLRQSVMSRHEGESLRTDSDEILFAKVVSSGDPDAFKQLITRYRRPLIALSVRMLGFGRRDQAEDVAQETFIAVYERRSQFRRGLPFRPWLYRIAVNRCLDRLRRAVNQPDNLLNVEQCSSDCEPFTELFAADCRAALLPAIDQLEPNLRAVFLLHYMEDMPYDEIAQAVARPIGTVKTHLFRARAKLRQALSEYIAP